MTTRPATAGPRQTVQRVMHPKRGECWAVYNNGPSFIQPIGGEPIAMRVRNGGASANPPRSWLYAEDPEFGCVQMDIPPKAEREPYEVHTRMYHPRAGEGWLVDLFGSERTFAVRFEPDKGEPFTFEWKELCVGRPAYREKSNRAGSRVPPHSPEEMKWHTYVTNAGEILTFRKDSAPGPDVDDTIPKPKRKRAKSAAKVARSSDALARRIEEIKRHNAAVAK